MALDLKRLLHFTARPHPDEVLCVVRLDTRSPVVRSLSQSGPIVSIFNNRGTIIDLGVKTWVKARDLESLRALNIAFITELEER